MASGHRLLGRLILAAWLLSLLAWIYIIVRVFTEGCVTGGCRFDFYAPLINGVPLLNFLTLGLITFVLSFTFMVLYLSFWWHNIAHRSISWRFAGALLLATCLHSLLLFGYLVGRMIINQAPIHSPFIDILLPWLTFLRLAAIALFLGVSSLMVYLAFFRRPEQRSIGQHLD